MTLSIVMAIYGQPKMLAKQVEVISDYPVAARQSIEVVIVDDHGDPPVNVGKVMELGQRVKVQLFRVVKNIPWNQMGARNWGMHHASPGPCMMLDPDMVIEPDMIEKLIQAASQLNRGTVIKFGLKHMSGRKGVDMTSPNTWILHREDFFACGGYDEEFAGHKGWSDCLLQETLKEFYRVQERPDLNVSFFLPSDGISDAMVLSLDRNVAHNRALKIRKNELIKKHGGFRRYVQKGLKPKNFKCPVKRLI